jgi:ribosomal protein S18 acetylase RimI-like enzyme
MHERPMNATYFKRFKMEVDLNEVAPVPALPEFLYWVPWHDAMLDRHAETTFECFHHEMDAAVFPSLSSRHGCHALMKEIRCRPGFVAEATWLVASSSGIRGAVQGRRDRMGWGAIQNLGVAAESRGRGIGTALLLKALHGFRRAGLGRAYLEVTAQNEGAIRLYRRVGFRCRKTLYKIAGETFALAEV